MKRAWLVLLPFLCACDPVPLDIDLVTDLGADVPADGVAPADPGPDAAVPDSGTDWGIDVPPPEDIPQTCLSILKDWQCVAAQNCPAWQACAGPLGCDEPPCWGVCEKVPGACLPRMGERPCRQDADCSPGWACADRVPSGDGVCKTRPSAEDCWADENCASGYCAGVLPCPPDAACPGPAGLGRCAARPPTGSCYGDRDCPAGQVCDGACVPGTAGCTARTGTCSATPRATCTKDADCKPATVGAPNPTPFCTGSPGFCTEPPARTGGDCWEDGDCAPGQLCRGAGTCPPGTACFATAHAGLCGEPPAPGEGVRVTQVDGVFPATGGRFIVANEGPVPIYYVSCRPILVEMPGPVGPDGQQMWITVGNPDDPLCDPYHYKVLRLAPGSARFLRTDPVSGSKGERMRIVLPYHLGCPPGATTFEGCRVKEEFQAISPEAIGQ